MRPPAVAVEVDGMRTTRALLSIGLLAVSACAPELKDVRYQGLKISLWGPDVDIVDRGDAVRDPFAVTKKYEVELKFWEDAAGTVPYADQDTLPPHLTRFTATPKPFEGPGERQVITPAEDYVLPRLAEGQEFIYVSAEIFGLNSNGAVAARARCGVQALANRGEPSATNPEGNPSLAETVSCHAFYGLVGKWNPVPRPAIARRRFAAAPLPDGRVIIAGGLAAVPIPGGNSSPISDVEIFDPLLNAGRGGWERAGALSAPRSGLTATVVGSGNVLFIGGAASTGFSDKVDVFDVTSKSMKAATPMVLPRGEHGAAPISGDLVLAVGGRAADATPNVSADVVTFPAPNYLNFRTGIGDLFNPCVAQVAANKVLVLGGSADKAIHEYNGTAFRPLTTALGLARSAPRCAVVDGAVFVVGGSTDNDSRRMEVWKNDAIEARGQFPTPLLDHAIAVSNGRVVVSGGVNPLGTDPAAPLKSSWFVKAATAEIVPRENQPSLDMTWPRAEHVLVPLADGTVMAIGGRAAPGAQPGDIPGAEIFVVPDN